MKIAIIQRFLPSLSRGGVGHFTHELANALQSRGHEVTVFTQDLLPEGARYQVRVVGGDQGCKKSKFAPFFFPFQIARENFEDFDIVHAQGDDQFLNNVNIPVVRTMHGSSLIEAYYNGIKRWSIKHFLLHLYFYFWEFMASLRASKVVAVSEDTRQFYPRLDAIVPNGINDVFYEQVNVEKSENPTILFVGEVFSRKRGDLLIDLFQKEVLKQVPDAELWLVSPEKMEQPHIHSFSGLSTEEVALKFKQAWVLCLPSSYEGFGRPYAEALASGLPVVASQNPGAYEVLKNGEFGEIAEDSQIAKALIKILKSEGLRKEMSEKGIARAADFSWQQVVDAYERVYASCMKGKASE